MVMRVCQRGHELKPENTYVRPNGKRTCKTCRQAYEREYRQRNLEKLKAYEREYRQRNPEKRKAYRREYRQQNPEKRKAYDREYRQRNLEKRKAYRRAYYEQHRDELLAYAKRHHRELKERYGGRPWANQQALVRREQERRGIKRED